MIKKCLFSLVFCFFLIFVFNTPVFSQGDITSSAVAITLPIEGEVAEGSVLCSGRQSVGLCQIELSTSIYAVVSGKPAVALESDLVENSYLVVDSGKAKVRVSNKNGNIISGELLTSSEIPGVAVKADRNGYVLGTALEDYQASSEDQIGTILVSINIHPSSSFTDDRSNLLEVLRKGLAAPLLTPLSALRYILASFVTIASFLLGFTYFGRLAKAAIDAIGRNPLAHKTINLTVIFHILVTIIIALAGIGIAYLILAI